MKKIETNIYAIENLDELNCKYRLYRVRGLSPESDNYERNMQLLVDRLSRSTRSPCVTVARDGQTYIAQPDRYPELPKTFDAIAGKAAIEMLDGLTDLKFGALTPDNLPLAVRFLQFVLQGAIFADRSMWQPSSGQPFYSKTPDIRFRDKVPGVDLYRGFSYRVVPLPSNGLGIAIDRKTKYVSRQALPADIISDKFRSLKGTNVVYEYGSSWYEVKLHELLDMNVSEYMIGEISLFDLVHAQYKEQAKSPLLAALPRDCAVVSYRTKTGQVRYMPSAMCRTTVETKRLRGAHSFSIASPVIRRRDIQTIANKYCSRLKFNGVRLKLSRGLATIGTRRLAIPVLQFGGNKTLDAAKLAKLDAFPGEKNRMLFSDDAGFYSRKPFDNQYFILPESAMQTYGSTFISDLKDEVNNAYKPGVPYAPQVVTYDDSGRRSFTNIGQRIIAAVDDTQLKPGFGVVMIPRLPSSHSNKEDQLANLVMMQLLERNLYVSIIHTNTAEDNLHIETTPDGGQRWILTEDRKQRGVYRGYLKVRVHRVPHIV